MSFMDKVKNVVNANKDKIDRAKIAEGLDKAKAMVAKKDGRSTTTTGGASSTATGTPKDTTGTTL